MFGFITKEILNITSKLSMVSINPSFTNKNSLIPVTPFSNIGKFTTY